MSVEQSTGLAEWFAAVQQAKSATETTRRGRHHHRPALDTTVEPASVPLPGVGPDPLGHVRAGDPDPDPSWQDADASLCNALSPTIIPVPGEDGEEFTLRYACTRYPHPAPWQHIAADAVHGVIEVWHGDESIVDTTVLAVAAEAPVDEVVTEAWLAIDGDIADLSPGDRVRAGELTVEQHEALAVVLDVWNALRDLGTDLPQTIVEVLCNAEALLTPRAGA